MKCINLIAVILLMGTFSFAQEKGTFTDSRDGKKYKTVKIGKQTWMAENLNYEMDESFCYEEKPEKCREYGRLYSLKAALESCPDGWRLPIVEDYQVLMGKAKEVSQESMVKRYPPICSVLEKQQHDKINEYCKDSPNYNSLAFNLKLHSGSYSSSHGWKGDSASARNCYHYCTETDSYAHSRFWTSTQFSKKDKNVYYTASLNLSSSGNSVSLFLSSGKTNDIIQQTVLQSVRCIKVTSSEKKGEKVKYTGVSKAVVINQGWHEIKFMEDAWKENGF